MTYGNATVVAWRWLHPGNCVELRDDTAGVLRRAQAGEDIVITVNGQPVAHLVPVRPVRRRWLPATELVARLRTAQADPGLRDDLAWLAGDTTDDLGPIQ